MDSTRGTNSTPGTDSMPGTNSTPGTDSTPSTDSTPGTDSTTARLREICLGLPEATERLSHGSPAFFVRGKRQFVMLWPGGHHDAEFPQLWCAAPPGAQQELMAADPARFFRPPYVGHRGWVGVRLDRDPDWSEIAELCADAFRTVAPKTLVARLDEHDPVEDGNATA